MFTHILVCLDGSDQAFQAAQVAVEVGTKNGAALTAITVDDSSTRVPPLVSMVREHLIDPAVPENATEPMQEVIERRMDQLVQNRGITYRFLRETGHPVAKIVEEAKRDRADLITLGSRGMGIFKSLLLGSISDGVAHYASCPVLIVRGQAAPFKRILLASDGSAGAQKAASAAFLLAQQSDAALTVLNVFEPSGPFIECDSNPNPVEALEEQLEREKSYKAVGESLQSIIQQIEVPHLLHQARGHPVQTIVEYAEHGKFDLIVLGSRGLGVFKSLLLGSVSYGVVHHAPCSVMIVH